jgi:hypothetical protein
MLLKSKDEISIENLDLPIPNKISNECSKEKLKPEPEKKMKNCERIKKRRNGKLRRWISWLDHINQNCTLRTLKQ